MDLNSSDSDSGSENEDAHTSQRQRTASKVFGAREDVEANTMISACSSHPRTASEEFSLKDPPLYDRAREHWRTCVYALEAANAYTAPVQTLSPLVAPSPSAASPLPTHSEQAVPQPAKVPARAGSSSAPEDVEASPMISSRRDDPLREKPRGRAPNGTNGLSMHWSGTKYAGRWVESEGMPAASMEGGPKGVHGRDTGAYIGLAVSKTFDGTPARTQLLEPPTTALLISRSSALHRSRHFQGQDRRLQTQNGLSH